MKALIVVDSVRSTYCCLFLSADTSMQKEERVSTVATNHFKKQVFENVNPVACER